jgi:hypothetical protein
MWENIKQWILPTAPLFLFLIVIFSINKIINLAMPVNFEKLDNNNQITNINNLLKNPANLNYESTTKALARPLTIHSSGDYFPKINNLPPDQQDALIRSKLLELKTEILTKHLNEMFESSKPLIFQIYFWIYALIGWAASISGGLMLEFWTKKYIKKVWGEG